MLTVLSHFLADEQADPFCFLGYFCRLELLASIAAQSNRASPAASLRNAFDLTGIGGCYDLRGTFWALFAASARR